jgi:hypothetical protein
MQYFTETSRVKSIDIADLTKQDESDLAGIGISQAHLIRNLKKRSQPTISIP